MTHQSISSWLQRLGGLRLAFFLFIAVLAAPNIGLAITEPVHWGVRLCNVLLPVGAYWLLASLGRNIGRTIWLMFPLVFLAAFQIVLLFLFGQSIIGVDMFLNVVTTNPDEAFELLGQLIPAIVCVVVLYVPFLVMGVVAIRRHTRLPQGFVRRQRRVAMTVFAMGVAATAVCRMAVPMFRVNADIFPANVCCNLVLAVERGWQTAHYDETSASFSYGARQNRAAGDREVYVLVVGETARAANFGIYGYGRNTTPRLAATDGLTVFGDALTQSNTTHKSVPMLLSPITPDNYDAIYRTKGIITAFHEAGFHTAFISNQRRNHSFIDFFGMEADDCRFVRDSVADGSPLDDMALLDGMKEVMAERHDKLFVVIHTYGSHFCYNERYPESEARFRPDTDMKARKDNRRQLMNGYDNTIAYTDLLLSRIVGMLKADSVPSAMLYTSDHGEDIYDDSRNRFLHASPVPTYWQLHVPLLVWTSGTYAAARPDAIGALSANRRKPVGTSTSVFHTMLDLAGVSAPLLDTTLSVASPAYKPRPRHYLNDRNRPVALGSLGMRDYDWDMFRKMGVRAE